MSWLSRDLYLSAVGLGKEDCCAATKARQMRSPTIRQPGRRVLSTPEERLELEVGVEVEGEVVAVSPRAPEPEAEASEAELLSVTPLKPGQSSFNRTPTTSGNASFESDLNLLQEADLTHGPDREPAPAGDAHDAPPSRLPIPSWTPPKTLAPTRLAPPPSRLPSRWGKEAANPQSVKIAEGCIRHTPVKKHRLDPRSMATAPVTPTPHPTPTSSLAKRSWESPALTTSPPLCRLDFHKAAFMAPAADSEWKEAIAASSPSLVASLPTLLLGTRRERLHLELEGEDISSSKPLLSAVAPPLPEVPTRLLSPEVEAELSCLVDHNRHSRDSNRNSDTNQKNKNNSGAAAAASSCRDPPTDFEAFAGACEAMEAAEATTMTTTMTTALTAVAPPQPQPLLAPGAGLIPSHSPIKLRSGPWEFPLSQEQKRDRVLLIADQEVQLAEKEAQRADGLTRSLQLELDRLKRENRELREALADSRRRVSLL